MAVTQGSVRNRGWRRSIRDLPRGDGLPYVTCPQGLPCKVVRREGTQPCCFLRIRTLES